jgi:hypothetical protein
MPGESELRLQRFGFFLRDYPQSPGRSEISVTETVDDGMCVRICSFN